MSSWDWVILFVIVAWIVYRSKASSMPEKVAFLYYTNIKPALDKLGFEGTYSDAIEEMNWIESTYHLEDHKLALDKTGFKDLELNKVDFRRPESFHVNNGELANVYAITFRVQLANGRNKGILELTVKNQYKEKELGKNGVYMVTYFAPIHFFNSVNLKKMVSAFFEVIEDFNKKPTLKRELYVYGAKLTQQEEGLGSWLPLIYPDGNETSEKSKKAAYKIMAKGYDNSIVRSS